VFVGNCSTDASSCLTFYNLKTATVRCWVALISFRLQIHKPGFAFHKPPVTTLIYVTKFFFQNEHFCNYFLMTDYLFKGNYRWNRQKKSSKSYIECSRWKPALSHMNPFLNCLPNFVEIFFNITPSYIFTILSSLHFFLAKCFRSVHFLCLPLSIHSCPT
jgi:hypothetical protein